jgi:hypothetical protein
LTARLTTSSPTDADPRDSGAARASTRTAPSRRSSGKDDRHDDRHDKTNRPDLDKDGKPTGRTKLVHDGEGGITGYLIWLGKNNPAAYAPLLGRVLPFQINQRTEQHTKVVYETVEEVRARLIARRIDPEVLERAMAPKWPAPPPLPKPGSVQ